LYQVIILLEKCIYPRKPLVLTAISHKVVDDLSRFYAPEHPVPVIYYGLDVQRFNPARCQWLRPSVRQELNLPHDAFVILLIGNDWKKKGLPSLIKAMGQIQQSNLRLLVVGRDQMTPYRTLIEHYHVQDQVHFLPPRRDVEWYYAAADVYAGPSLEDAFALPPAEAMACGVPAIVSSQAGVSEIVTHGVDAFVLHEPTDASELAGYIKQLYEDPSLRTRMGEQASITTLQYTWKRNAAMLHMLFQEVMLRKRKAQAHD
jgi:UDP-glucose:(heptosyl)LPS alpha-1,3-glucosyltransferase